MKIKPGSIVRMHNDWCLIYEEDGVLKNLILTGPDLLVGALTGDVLEKHLETKTEFFNLNTVCKELKKQEENDE